MGRSVDWTLEYHSPLPLTMKIILFRFQNQWLCDITVKPDFVGSAKHTILHIQPQFIQRKMLAWKYAGIQTFIWVKNHTLLQEIPAEELLSV
jgi:hypothetical protein